MLLANVNTLSYTAMYGCSYQKNPYTAFGSFLPAEFLQWAFQGATAVNHYKLLALSKPIKTGSQQATLQPISHVQPVIHAAKSHVPGSKQPAHKLILAVAT